MPQPLYTRGDCPRGQLDGKLYGPQSFNFYLNIFSNNSRIQSLEKHRDLPEQKKYAFSRPNLA
jgi:hypothetical protein